MRARVLSRERKKSGKMSEARERKRKKERGKIGRKREIFITAWTAKQVLKEYLEKLLVTF